MQTETARIDIAKPAAEVWALVGEFGGLDTWMAGIDSCTVEGDVRTIETLGMTLTEQLVGRDAEGRSITYSIVGEGAPVAKHEATITVLDAGDGASEVTWDVSVEPDEAAAMFKDIYQGALGQVKTTLEG
ncbi:MAG TPA: SRPBCC family protein [Iamia sp.]|nr:SRPBCC family protein [Iamia sp.]